MLRVAEARGYEGAPARWAGSKPCSGACGGRAAPALWMTTPAELF